MVESDPILFILYSIFIIRAVIYYCISECFFKDMGQLVQVFLQVGMWLAPIMWSETMMPENLRWILKLNPFYYVVEGIGTVLSGMWDFGSAEVSIYFWCISVVIFAIGAGLFRKLKPHFADVL